VCTYLLVNIHKYTDTTTYTCSNSNNNNNNTTDDNNSAKGLRQRQRQRRRIVNGQSVKVKSNNAVASFTLCLSLLYPSSLNGVSLVHLLSQLELVVAIVVIVISHSQQAKVKRML